MAKTLPERVTAVEILLERLCQDVADMGQIVGNLHDIYTEDNAVRGERRRLRKERETRYSWTEKLFGLFLATMSVIAALHPHIL